MAIGTYEYISDDGTSFYIRMKEDYAKFIGATAIDPSTPIQPEKIFKNGTRPIKLRYMYIEENDRLPTPENPLKRVKVIVTSKLCNPGYGLFLNGGNAYLGAPYRVCGSVSESRVFYGD